MVTKKTAKKKSKGFLGSINDMTHSVAKKVNKMAK